MNKIDTRDPQQIMKELFNDNSAIVDRFCENYSEEILVFSTSISEASRKFCLLDNIAKKGDRHAYSAGFAYLSIENIFVSMKLFLQGLMIPSGNLARQSIESLCASILCGYPGHIEIKLKKGKTKEIDYVQNLKEEKSYARPYKALEIIQNNIERIGVNEEAIEALAEQRMFYNHYSHPSHLAIAACMSLGGGETLFFGGSFDEKKKPQYDQEIESRLKLSKLYPNVIENIVEVNKCI